jgi:hypothetical protein
MRWMILASCALLPFGVLHGESATEGSTPKPSAAERSLDSLKTIAEPLAVALTEAQKLETELRAAGTEDAKQEIQNRIDAESARIRQLRDNFRNILGGSEAAEYEDNTATGTSIQEQISELIQPVLSEMREATAEPRELDALRKSLSKWHERKRKADIVIGRIDQLIDGDNGKVLSSELKSARALWASRQAEALSQIAVAKVQIDERESARRSLWERLSTGFSGFFRSRGMNLMLAIFAGVGGFFLSRKTYSWIRRVSPVHKQDKNNFTGRLSDVLALATAVIVSLSAVILVFYIRGDWLLLTLVLIFLIGVAWAGKTTVPPYLEQIRMVLNLGSVREGERVIYLGLPWKVSSLGFFTTFTNPNLDGGMMRIPIKDVMGMISRPIADREVWFPTETDHWIILTDGTFGKTVTQTPDQVVVVQLGGSMKTYPTADFLKLAPENLSKGFRLSVTFGIDYRHREEATTTIPEIFEQTLTTELMKLCGREAVRSVQTEFSSASASSLDYTVLADFDGSVAHRYKALRRSIQSICVDVCNTNGWGIPFPQITVHQG